ncbi:MAG TPA: BatD family protein, partial [bacterium]|nr:BatD family protein [bacterium]
PDINIPNIPNFTIINQRREFSGGSHFQMIINNKIVQSTTTAQTKILHLTLRPEKYGELLIGPFTINVNNQNYAINPISVRVKNERKYKNVSEKLDKLADNPVFFIATLSENKCYVNQPIYVDFSLFYRTRLRLTNQPQLPQFKDFQTEKLFEIEDEQNIKGKQFKVLTLRQVLYPLKKGTLKIEPAALNVEINYDPFWGRGRPVALTTEPLNLTVIEPENFPSGGLLAESLKIQHKLSTKQIKEYEAFILTLELKGRYNIKRAPKLELNLPDEIELYSSSDSTVINIDHSGLHGSKFYNFILIPRKSGNYNISIKPLNYFSYQQKKIFNLSYEIPISVEQSDKIHASTQPVMILTGGSPTVIFDKRDIAFISEKFDGPNIFNKRSLKKYGLINIIPILGVIIAFGISQFFNKINYDRVFARKFFANRKAQKKLKYAKELASSNKLKDVYSELYNVITQFIVDKFNFTSGYGLSTADIQNLFLDKKIDELFTNEIIETLKKFDFKRFSPITPDFNEVSNDIEYTTKLLTKLERLKIKK